MNNSMLKPERWSRIRKVSGWKRVCVTDSARASNAAFSAVSMYVSSFTAPAGGGWVDVAAKLPGDIKEVAVSGSHGCVSFGPGSGSRMVGGAFAGWLVLLGSGTGG